MAVLLSVDRRRARLAGYLSAPSDPLPGASLSHSGTYWFLPVSGVIGGGLGVRVRTGRAGLVMGQVNYLSPSSVYCARKDETVGSLALH